MGDRPIAVKAQNEGYRARKGGDMHGNTIGTWPRERQTDPLSVHAGQLCDTG